MVASESQLRFMFSDVLDICPVGAETDNNDKAYDETRIG